MERATHTAALNNTMRSTVSGQAEAASAEDRISLVQRIGDAHCHAQLDIASHEKIVHCQVCTTLMPRHNRVHSVRNDYHMPQLSYFSDVGSICGFVLLYVHSDGHCCASAFHM